MPFPVTGVLDNFDRADGDLGSAWTADVNSGGYARPDIATNQAKTDAGNAFASAWWNAEKFGPDCEVFATVSALPTLEIRLYLRLQSPGLAALGGLELSVESVNAFINRVNGGTRSLMLNLGAHSLAAGNKVGLSVIERTVQAWKNTGSGWTEWGAAQTDYSGDPAGHIGLLFQNDTVARLDDFGGGALVPSIEPTYADLPKYLQAGRNTV